MFVCSFVCSFVRSFVFTTMTPSMKLCRNNTVIFPLPTFMLSSLTTMVICPYMDSLYRVIDLVITSGHSSTVWGMSFNKSGDKFVTCSDDRTLRVWCRDENKVIGWLCWFWWLDTFYDKVINCGSIDKNKQRLSVLQPVSGQNINISNTQ